MRSFINPSGALFFTKCGPFDNDSSMTNTCASWLWAANKMLRYRFEISMSDPVAQGSIRLEKQSPQRVSCLFCFYEHDSQMKSKSTSKRRWFITWFYWIPSTWWRFTRIGVLSEQPYHLKITFQVPVCSARPSADTVMASIKKQPDTVSGAHFY